MILTFILASLGLAAAASGAKAQQSAPAQPTSQDSYQGVSQPPNDPIMTSELPPAKPSAGVAITVTAPQAYVAPAPQPTAPPPSYAPAVSDPDGDIVHPRPARPGELLEGTTIRVKLLDRLSSSETEKGEPFHGQVAFDVLQDGKVLIPAGSGIEGSVSFASRGHFGGHGSLRLKPDAVILPDGSRYMLHAETTGTPGSKTRMGSEGSINPGSRAKKDGIEYGAVVGTGAIAGAVIGGPVGALTGSLVGAGIVTTHLMVDHPQATLEPGSMVLFTLTEPMNLMSANN
jgi:hypothetical protein